MATSTKKKATKKVEADAVQRHFVSIDAGQNPFDAVLDCEVYTGDSVSDLLDNIQNCDEEGDQDVYEIIFKRLGVTKAPSRKRVLTKD